MNISNTNIQIAPPATGAGMPASSGSAMLTPEPVIQLPKVTDAEVVSKVIDTPIKPSNVSEAAKPTQETIAQTAQQLEQFVQSMGRNLSFSVDSTTGYNVVVVTNADGEVVRQLPSEELLKIAQAMQDTNSGLVNQRA